MKYKKTLTRAESYSIIFGCDGDEVRFFLATKLPGFGSSAGCESHAIDYILTVN